MELTAGQRMELVSAVSVGHDGSVSTRAQIVLAWHGNESATDIAVSVSGSVGQVSDVGLELPRSHVDAPGRPAVRTFSSAGNTGGLAMTIRFLRGQGHVKKSDARRTCQTNPATQEPSRIIAVMVDIATRACRRQGEQHLQP